MKLKNYFRLCKQNKIVGIKKLLLHICCAPCSTVSIERLKSSYNVTGVFYNPNIYPKSEYLKRLEETKKYCKKIGINLVDFEYNYKEWLNKIKGLENEPEGGRRCLKCFGIRLEKAAHEAARKKIEYFTTTLSISPYKNFEEIKRIGDSLGQKYGVKFLNIDFKKKDGFKKSIEISKKFNLYRQHYCGCEFSINLQI